MADKKSFLLRLPPDLWEELSRWAQDELRSVNGQIEYILRQALHKRKGRDQEDVAEKNPSRPDGHRDGGAAGT